MSSNNISINNDNKLSVDGNIVVNESANLVINITNKISQLSLIDVNDIALLKNAQSFLLETYTDVPQYRPMVKKITSVLTDNNFPTTDAKYWQCKSEAEVHFNELVRAFNKYDKALVDIEEIDYKIKSIDKLLNEEQITTEKYDPELIKFDKKRLIIKKNEYMFELKQLEKNIKYRIEEVTDWHKISENLKPSLKHKTYNEHIAEAHFKKLESRVAMAKENQDAAAHAIALDQLNTFKNILLKAAKEESEKQNK